jgi:isoleucyl-tRNA synthetase
VLSGAGDVVAYVLNPLPNLLGKKFGKEFPVVQKHLRESPQSDVAVWAQALLRGETVTVEIDGKSYEVTPEEVEVKQKSTEGFTVAAESGYVAALDARLTEELMAEGFAREVVRRIQTLRKDADFQIDDKIAVRYVASERLAKAIAQFGDYIQAETLSKTLEAGEPNDGFHQQSFTDDKEKKKLDGETLVLGVKRVKA